jgi:hypothetical protein
MAVVTRRDLILSKMELAFKEDADLTDLTEREITGSAESYIRMLSESDPTEDVDLGNAWETVTSSTPSDETETVVELTDDLAPAFLAELERTGSIRASARALGVDRRAAYARRYRDSQFRDAWDVIRMRQLKAASDDLMFALDGLLKLSHCGWECAVDELVNVSFNPDCEAPSRDGISLEQLAAARERLDSAGRAWAAAVALARYGGIPAAPVDTLVDPQIDRRRLDAAFDFIGHKGSPTFRRQLAGAYDRAAVAEPTTISERVTS